MLCYDTNKLKNHSKGWQPLKKTYMNDNINYEVSEVELTSGLIALKYPLGPTEIKKIYNLHFCLGPKGFFDAGFLSNLINSTVEYCLFRRGVNF